MVVLDIVFMIILFVLFLLAGVFGGIALVAFMRENRRPLKWSIPLALLCMLAFMSIMFVLLFK